MAPKRKTKLSAKRAKKYPYLKPASFSEYQKDKIEIQNSIQCSENQTSNQCHAIEMALVSNNRKSQEKKPSDRTLRRHERNERLQKDIQYREKREEEENERAEERAMKERLERERIKLQSEVELKLELTKFILSQDTEEAKQLRSTIVKELISKATG